MRTPDFYAKLSTEIKTIVRSLGKFNINKSFFFLTSTENEILQEFLQKITEIIRKITVKKLQYSEQFCVIYFFIKPLKMYNLKQNFVIFG